MSLACGVWEREKEFYEALKKAGERLTKGSVDGLTNIALDDEWVCYKHVVALLCRQIRRTAPGGRVAVLYVLSNILRFSKRRYGGRDKYADRVASVIPEIFSPLSECPAQQVPKVCRVVETWRKDGIFREEDLGRISKVLGLGKAGKVEGLCEDGSCTRAGGEGEECNANRDVFEDGTSPKDRPGFQPRFYPTVGTPSAKSGGGSNSGGEGRDAEEEEYDPLSAADYIDGCHEAQEAMYSINLVPVPPIGEQFMCEGLEEIVSGVAMEKAGVPYGGDACVGNVLHAGAGGGGEHEARGDFEGNVMGGWCGWDGVWPTIQHRQKIGNVWVQRNIQAESGEQAWSHVVNFGSSTSRVGANYCPIDYTGTYGFGQGMDGPPEIPLITQSGVITGNHKIHMGENAQGIDEIFTGAENGCCPEQTLEDANFRFEAREAQCGDSGFQEITQKEPIQSAASSIMDVAESIAGSICSIKEPWEPDGNVPDGIVPCPPMESPPPLPSDSFPDTPPPLPTNPPPPPPLPPGMASVQWSDSKCGDTYRYQSHKVLASGLENYSIAKKPACYLPQHSLPFPPS